jgi:hypothetical protein
MLPSVVSCQPQHKISHLYTIKFTRDMFADLRLKVGKFHNKSLNSKRDFTGERGRPMRIGPIFGSMAPSTVEYFQDSYFKFLYCFEIHALFDRTD